MEEIYDHTENKTDVQRNMTATLFVNDPVKFSTENEDVNKVLKQNVAWPKGYIPEQFVIQKPALKKTKEEIDREILKEKHSLKMAPLNKFYLDDAIKNLQKVCTTENALVTYKTAGWKATFM